MLKKALIDAGPLVAFLSKDDAWHNWSASQFERFPQFSTCEAVLAEACARLAYYEQDQSKVVDLVSSGAVRVEFRLDQVADRVSYLMKKYRDRSMDFADACLVAMTERFSNSVVVTLDTNAFAIYRRYEREVVPFVSPQKR